MKKSFPKTVTFYLDDNHKEVHPNQKTWTFTLQIIKT